MLIDNLLNFLYINVFRTLLKINLAQNDLYIGYILNCASICKNSMEYIEI